MWTTRLDFSSEKSSIIKADTHRWEGTLQRRENKDPCLFQFLGRWLERPRDRQLKWVQKRPGSLWFAACTMVQLTIPHHFLLVYGHCRSNRSSPRPVAIALPITLFWKNYEIRKIIILLQLCWKYKCNDFEYFNISINSPMRKVLKMVPCYDIGTELKWWKRKKKNNYNFLNNHQLITQMGDFCCNYICVKNKINHLELKTLNW